MSEEDSVRGSNGFSTKEMLLRLETIVDRIEAKLDAKTDKRDFDAFEIRAVATEAATNLRLVALETQASSTADLSRYRHWLIGVGLTACIAVVTAAISLAALFHS